MSGHTPGPWKTDREYDHEVVLGSDGAIVADCAITLNPKFGDRSGSVNRANARLIAAAPEMYEALKWLVRDYDAGFGIVGQDQIVAARAALAKAEYAKD